MDRLTPLERELMRSVSALQDGFRQDMNALQDGLNTYETGSNSAFGGPAYGDRDRAELFGSALGDHRGASARHAGETERGLEVMRSADEDLRGAGREFTRLR